MNTDPVLDKLANETSPGVQSRRYRILHIQFDAENRQLALLEEVNAPDTEIPIRWIDTNFLPHSFREQIAYQDGEDDPTYPKLPIEFEITVKRVEPTPGFVSKLSETVGALS